MNNRVVLMSTVTDLLNITYVTMQVINKYLFFATHFKTPYQRLTHFNNQFTILNNS